MSQPTPPSQTTIASPVSLSGIGLFLSRPVTLTFRPAPANHGIVFVRSDLNHAPIAARIGNVVKRPRRTALRQGDATVDTTEHCLSAVAGLGLDNLLIELDGPEVPGMDGSAAPFIEALTTAGRVEQDDAPRRIFELSQPVMVRQDDATLAAIPSEQPGLQLVYELDYPQEPAIGRRLAIFHLGKDDYTAQIAPTRTFILEAEAAALRERGFGSHLTPQSLLVVGKQGPVGGNRFRFDDEPARHKLLDLIGDLMLLGAPLQAKVIASKSGHPLNHALVRAMLGQLREQTHQALAVSRNVVDIRRLQRILPHRYPMLLVDRVIELDGERRALGVKNVTANEPYFAGHFPNAPIMPGVLIVEAMAQLSGVLIGQRLENQGKLAILLSLERVKLRKPVVPGDQLILEAESVRVRTSIAHMRCRAYVGQFIVAEAEVKFMIVDGQQL